MASKTFSKSTQQSAPSFSKLLENVTCNQGQDALLECSVQGYPIPDIRWEKGGIQLANSRRLHTDRQGDRCSLHIKSCTRLETGVFKCIATNKFGSASTTSTVRFDAVPPKPVTSKSTPTKTSSSPEEKITEFQKNISRLKKVAKTADNEPNGTPPKSAPVFKEFPLRRTVQPNSSKEQTDPPSAPVLKKSPVNGTSAPVKTVLRTPVTQEAAGLKKTAVNGFPKPERNVSKVASISVVDSNAKKDVPADKGGDRPEKVSPPVKKPSFRTPETAPKKEDSKGNSTPLADTPKTNGHLKTKKGTNKGITKGSVRQRKQAPKFVLTPMSKVVKEGESVKFMCTCTGVPEPTVTWKRRDGEMSGGERVLFYQTDCMHILEMWDLAPGDAGDYQVVLSNEAGSAEASALLEVRARKVVRAAPRIIRPLGDVSVTDGHPCSLSCEVSALPAPTCQWSRDGRALEPHPDFQNSFDGQTATLTVRESFPDDEGTYTLTAVNEAGQATTSCRLTVIKNVVSDSEGKAPVFTRKLNDLEVNDGDPLTLTIEVNGAEPTEIVWVHNETVIKNSPDFRYISSEDRKCHSLVIEETFPEDAGIYFCEAYNLYGEDVTACMVTVKLTIDSGEVTCQVSKADQTPSKDPQIVEKLISSAKKKTDAELKDAKNVFRRSLVFTDTQVADRHRCGAEAPMDPPGPEPPVAVGRRPGPQSGPKSSPAQIVKGPRSLAVLRGETITLRCQFVGAPKPTVSWIKAGKLVSPSERVTIEDEDCQAVLSVRGATTDDSGKYVVVVENSGGSDCQFASVSVEGPPDPLAERPVVSDLTDHSLVLAWSGSPFDGGSVITGYAVEMCTLPETRWQRLSVARHSTSHSVKNLLPNRSYTFRVRAENVHGFSEPSPESEPVFITDAEPDAVEPEVFEDKNVVVQNGNNFGDRYEFLEVVGKGRFGVVHRCRDKRSDEVRAAKVIRCVKQKDKQKVREEVDIMNQLRHSKLLQLVAAYESPKELVLVMEYISGGELFERVIADDFVLLEKDCVLFLHQICEGVRYMHNSHVIHLDLKPENILCVTKTSHQIKIIDFGLARKYDVTESIRVLFGTPEFVAPEVIGYEPVSPASDMWSVGVICYVLLSGLSPFMGDNDAETFANITRVEYDYDDEAFEAISEDAKDFINQLFMKRPEKRLSAEDCLKHFWLAKDQNRMSVVQLCTDKLKKFIIRRKWQKTGNAIRALGRMVSLSSPSRSVSSTSSRSDSELSFTIPAACSPAIAEKDEDSESGVFLANECPSLGQVQS